LHIPPGLAAKDIFHFIVQQVSEAPIHAGLQFTILMNEKLAAKGRRNQVGTIVSFILPN
jgi:hypothetical protein